MITVTNVCFIEAIKLGYMVMKIDWAIMVIMPLRWNHFGFQRMDDKVKDGLVLSVVWC